MNINELKFSDTSILPLLSSDLWQFTDATFENNTLTILPGGHAACVPTQTIVNKMFKYFKIDIDFVSTEISSISNFKNMPYCFIVESYKNENNEIYRNRARCLGFNTFNPVGDVDGHYIDTTIFASLNKSLGYYLIDIRNNTESNLIINSIGVYSSIDISADQIGNVVDSINSASDPNGFKVYCDDQYDELNGLAVTLRNSNSELKYKPIWSNGLLSEIKTNFGIDYPVLYVPEQIDIDN